MLPYFLMFKQLGMLDTRLALVLINMSIVLPYAVWMMKGFIDAVPLEIEESAMVDGAHRARVIWEIVIPAALPGIITDLTSTGTFVAFNFNTIPYRLRDDTDRLSLLLAGAVTRYINERVRAEVQYVGFLAWGDLLGQILTVIQQGDDVNLVGAPITSIEWTLGDSPRTIIKTGYA